MVVISFLVLVVAVPSMVLAQEYESTCCYDGVTYVYDIETKDVPQSDVELAPVVLWGLYLRLDVETSAHGWLDGSPRLSAEFVAPSGARSGLNSAGGLIEQTGTNTAGGRIFTSTGKITQRDFAGIVNSALYRGDDMHIFSGAHGLANGTLVTDATLLADDVAAFGRLPGVQIHDLPSMSPAQIREILESPGTIIGGFCDSGACLAPFGG